MVPSHRKIQYLCLSVTLAAGAGTLAAAQTAQQSSLVVRQAQRELRVDQYYNGRIDGINGPRTRAAVRKYQRDAYLPVTGRLDRRTLTSMGIGSSSRSVGQASREANMPPSKAEVRNAQEQLMSKGLYFGNIDGIMGPQTHKAISEFQSRNGLAVNGQLDRETAVNLGVAGPGTYMQSAGSAITNNYSQAGQSVAKGSTGMASRMRQGQVGSGFQSFGQGVGQGAKSVGRGTANAAKRAYHGAEKAIVPHH